jgi:hypothetical protein
MVFQIKNNQLTKNIVSGAAAIAVLAGVGIAAAPAQSSTLTGELEWDDSTSNFFEDVNPDEDDTFSVTFSPEELGGLASVFIATGEFAPPFPTTPLAPPDFYELIPPPTGTFKFVRSQNSSFIYKLQNDLVFNFDANQNGVFALTEDVQVTFKAGEQFLGSFDNGSVGFEELDVDASVIIAGRTPLVLTEELTFGDSVGGTGGEYGAIVETTTTVPEPASILGLLAVGGLGLSLKRKKQS